MTVEIRNTLSERECVFLALGSNLGNREDFLQFAVRRLKENGFQVQKVSSFYETEPVNCVAGAGAFLNGVLYGFWDRTPEELLNLTQSIEREAGRPADHTSQQSRNLDIDLILFGNRILNSEHLTIPHPRAQIREFVLRPLSRIAPQVIFPDSGKKAFELLESLQKN